MLLSANDAVRSSKDDGADGGVRLKPAELLVDWYLVHEIARLGFELFWSQIAIAALLHVLHYHDRLLAEVMPITPPWENPRWWQS